MFAACITDSDSVVSSRLLFHEIFLKLSRLGTITSVLHFYAAAAVLVRRLEVRPAGCLLHALVGRSRRLLSKS